MTSSQNISNQVAQANITQATSDDLPDALALFDNAVAWLVGRGITGQWGTTPFSELPALRARFEEWIADGTLFIARLDGAPAGTIVLSERIPRYALHILSEFPEPAFYLEAFTTSRALVGQGVGRDLLRWAEDYAVAQGKLAIWLDCWADNPSLVAYYRGAGFQVARDFLVGSWRGMLFHKTLTAL